MTIQHDTEIANLRTRIRHSAAHVMADVVTRMFPDAKLGIGPPTDEGFYYDFLVDSPFTPEDVEQIEARMRKVISEDHSFRYREYSREQINDLNSGEPLKQEIISEIPEGEPISTFTHGEFEDLCAGPHVPSTGNIPAFKLLNVAGAYWRGDERRPMLQRIYGTAFESEEALDEHLTRLEEARRRDHRVLGRDLDLYSVHDETGPGLIIWHPKGARVRGLIEDLWKREHYRWGYDLVYTPHVGRSTLWETSGHLENFKENMFAVMDMEGQEYYLKPMNCPFHIMYYRNGLRSYRDLPMRIGELGSVYRFERGGTLHGMLRVRGMTQDDAHIFCRPDQIADEINGVLDLTFHLLNIFEFTDFSVMLSTRPEKAVGSEEEWDVATSSLRSTLEDRGMAYEVEEGRRSVLRSKDRRPHQGRHRAALAVYDSPVRLQPAAPVRAYLRRLRRRRASAVHGTQGAVRLDGAVHGGAYRALRRGVPDVARPRAGGDHTDSGPSSRVCSQRARSTCGQRTAGGGRCAERADGIQDTRGPAPEGALHADCGRPRDRRRGRRGQAAVGRRPGRGGRGRDGGHDRSGRGASVM